MRKAVFRFQWFWKIEIIIFIGYYINIPLIVRIFPLDFNVFTSSPCALMEEESSNMTHLANECQHFR